MHVFHNIGKKNQPLFLHIEFTDSCIIEYLYIIHDFFTEILQILLIWIQ